MARPFATPGRSSHILGGTLALVLGWPGNLGAQVAASPQLAASAEPALSSAPRGMAVGAEATPGVPPHAESSAALAALVAWAEKREVKLGVVVSDLESGAQLSYRPAVPLNPASNMKVLTVAAALDELGPNFRFETGLYGILDKHHVEVLTLRGNGDPALTTSDLWNLVDALVQTGVTSVGTLNVDQTRFDDQFVPPAFEQQPQEWAAFRAPVSAVALERNTVTLNVLPAAEGEPARVWFEPEGVVTIHGQVSTVKAGAGQDIRLTLRTSDGQLHADVGGRIASTLGRQRFEKRVDDPRLLPGLALRTLFKQRGVSVDQVILGATTEKNRLVYHTSPPLAELVSQLGKHSDNFYAEMLFKSLSSNRAGAPVGAHASTQASSEWLATWLARAGALPLGTRIVNGSGLFDANRIAPETLALVLTRSYLDPKLRSEMLAQLAVGGVDGTLRSRFRDAAKAFPIRAKTGTLRDAIALSGYVLRPGTRPPLVFSAVANGGRASASEVREHIDLFVKSLQH